MEEIKVNQENIRNFCIIYIVKVPSGVFTITNMSSSFHVTAFIYTKKSVSSTFPLKS